MLQKKAFESKNTFPILLVRLTHAVLVCYAISIIGITLLSPGYLVHFETTLAWQNAERSFVIAVAVPLLLGSLFSFLAAVTRSMFGTAIFFCTFLALLFVSLPFMINTFSPAHLVTFSLAAVYGLSAIVLARFSLEQPKSGKK